MRWSERGLWALDAREPLAAAADTPPVADPEPDPSEYPYAFGLLAARLPLRVLSMRRPDWPDDCESCGNLKVSALVFAHDKPDWPGHWSAVYRVCERCTPPPDLAEAWRPGVGAL